MATSCGPGTFVPVLIRGRWIWISLLILLLISLFGVNAEKNKNCKYKNVTIIRVNSILIHFFLYCQIIFKRCVKITFHN